MELKTGNLRSPGIIESISHLELARKINKTGRLKLKKKRNTTLSNFKKICFGCTTSFSFKTEWITLFFSVIRTSNFGAEAERFYFFFCDLSLKTFLMFLCCVVKYFNKSMRTWPGNLSKCIVCCDVVSICLSHGCAVCFDAANKMSRQPTLAKLGYS